MTEKLRDTAQRLRSDKARDLGEHAGNRFVTGVSTVGIGGSIAAYATYYLQTPEELHAHTVALVVFLWQTAVYVVTFLWRKRFGG